MAMTPFSGVRISWLTLARNRPLAAFASSARRFASVMRCGQHAHVERQDEHRDHKAHADGHVLRPEARKVAGPSRTRSIDRIWRRVQPQTSEAEAVAERDEQVDAEDQGAAFVHHGAGNRSSRRCRRGCRGTAAPA